MGINKFCIFCLQTDKTKKFNSEHIIPQSIGGNLYIDEVCEQCNSGLGRFVDSDILKLSEIVKAFEETGIPHDKSGIIKGNYILTGKTSELELPFIVKKDKPELVPQKLKDGSLVVSENDYKAVIKKSIMRDQHLREAGLSQNEIKNEINKLFSAYSKAAIDEIVHAPKLGVALKKRSDKFDYSIIPKGSTDVSRLIAKIFCEFFYLVGGRHFFEKITEFEAVYNFINTGEKSTKLQIYRKNPFKDEYAPLHYITLFVKPDENFPRLDVGFFGKIVFSLRFLTNLQDFWQEHEQRYKVSGIQGIHFEQDLNKHSKHFWWIFSDGTHKFARA